ncbi:SgcJ/EcaC family oxidoreductase [Nocardiopsis exhalans]|uniref:SgcJ/EcaC family oxidoreductase n=1 Tax=Nocardiopsis exhalans TaxID=163604 RepID=A0ABY5CZZ6_9ACTN|nr:SgcJ/EcaC family oxidoreductase [Nocardiopsis exhalans]USY17536.1 SgcJ/EcaC family oxidoreductase [Nocardiopsis exhalans]
MPRETTARHRELPGDGEAVSARILAEAGVREDPKYFRDFPSDEEREVLTVPQLIQGAWLENDADFFASVFTPDGSLLIQDEELADREEIRAFMASGFAGPLRGAHVSGWPLAMRFLGPDTALVVTQGGIVRDGEEGVAPEREIRAVWVIVRRSGRWRLMSHQSSPIRG